MELEIPGHRLSNILKPMDESTKQIPRMIYRSEYRGQAAVTRVMLKDLPVQYSKVLHGYVVKKSDAIGLPVEVQEIFGGYRIRTRMENVRGLPPVLDAGIAPTSLGSTMGYAYVTTTWVDGQTLEQRKNIPTAEAEQILINLLDLLGRLHANNVVYGDLKPGNVVVDGSSVHLVDLDTLREVTDGFAICTHLTERWSAPEQKEVSPILYLSSDIFSFGLVAKAILAGSSSASSGALLPKWTNVVDACLRFKAMDRPNTGALLSFLHRGSGELGRWNDQPYSVPDTTERVPDPVAPMDLSSVLDPAGGSSTVDSESSGDGSSNGSQPIVQVDWSALQRVLNIGWAKTTHSFGHRKAWVLGLAALTLTLLAWLFGGGYDTYKANGQAQALWDELKEFKTVREKNNSDIVGSIATRSDRPLDVKRTGFVLGVRALAKVWSHGWTRSSAAMPWSPWTFNRGMEYVSQALEVKRTPEALLALGILHSGACRKIPGDTLEEKARRVDHCEKARSALDEASERNGRSKSRAWMEVEIQWVAVMSEVNLGYHLYERSERMSSNEVLESSVKRCQNTWSRLPSSPINSRELVQDCLSAAGQLGRFDTYLQWSDWMVDYDLKNRNKVRPATRRHIFRAVHFDCGKSKLKFSKAGGVRRDPKARGNTTDLCRYVGAVALGCRDMADSLATKGTGRLWKSALDASLKPARTVCAL